VPICWFCQTDRPRIYKRGETTSKSLFLHAKTISMAIIRYT
jgi:hypothetical protein